MKTSLPRNRVGDPINIGCGLRFHPNWLNLDLTSSSPSVIAWDSRKGLPVPEASVPFVYTSHMVEHLEPEDAACLMREIHRTLVPRGILRVVVPDLSKLARWYLDAVSAAESEGFLIAWSRMHLLDQLVRRESGGRMRRLLAACSDQELALAVSRMGSEAVDTRNVEMRTPVGFSERVLASLRRPRALHRALQRLRDFAARTAVQAFLGKRGSQALRVGLFTTSGENHRWMYDSISLRRLLQSSGFSEVRTVSANVSGWPDWERENLDRDPDGQVYKPDSLFMEGRKADL